MNVTETEEKIKKNFKRMIRVNKLQMRFFVCKNDDRTR